MKQKNRPFGLFFFTFVAWSLYRYFFYYPEWFDEFVAKPCILLLPTIFLATIFEKKSLKSIGFSSQQLAQNIFIGLGAGIFIAVEAILTRQFKYGQVIFNPDHLTGVSLLTVILIPFVTGFAEEAVFRGYLFTNFLKSYKNEFFANALSTVLFVALHLPILLFVNHLSSVELLFSLVQLAILGALNGIIFARTKTLVAPTVTHGLWNLSAVLFR